MELFGNPNDSLGFWEGWCVDGMWLAIENQPNLIETGSFDIQIQWNEQPENLIIPIYAQWIPASTGVCWGFYATNLIDGEQPIVLYRPVVYQLDTALTAEHTARREALFAKRGIPKLEGLGGYDSSMFEQTEVWEGATHQRFSWNGCEIAKPIASGLV